MVYYEPKLKPQKKVLHEHFKFYLPDMVDPIDGSSIVFVKEVNFQPESGSSFVNFDN